MHHLETYFQISWCSDPILFSFLFFFSNLPLSSLDEYDCWCPTASHMEKIPLQRYWHSGLWLLSRCPWNRVTVNDGIGKLENRLFDFISIEVVPCRSWWFSCELLGICTVPSYWVAFGTWAQPQHQCWCWLLWKKERKISFIHSIRAVTKVEKDEGKICKKMTHLKTLPYDPRPTSFSIWNGIFASSAILVLSNLDIGVLTSLYMSPWSRDGKSFLTNNALHNSELNGSIFDLAKCAVMVDRAFSSRFCFNSSLFSVAKNEFCSADMEHIESSFWYDMSDVRFFSMRKLCGVEDFEMDSLR